MRLSAMKALEIRAQATVSAMTAAKYESASLAVKEAVSMK